MSRMLFALCGEEKERDTNSKNDPKATTFYWRAEGKKRMEAEGAQHQIGLNATRRRLANNFFVFFSYVRGCLICLPRGGWLSPWNDITCRIKMGLRWEIDHLASPNKFIVRRLIFRCKTFYILFLTSAPHIRCYFFRITIVFKLVVVICFVVKWNTHMRNAYAQSSCCSLASNGSDSSKK